MTAPTGETPLRRPSRLRRLTGVQILSTGSFVPDKVVTNADLGSLGYDADWIVQRTGIHERRMAPPGMGTSDMATAAAEQCLARAKIDPAEIDLVILGTFTPDMPVPASACVVQDRLGLNAAAMDLQSACAGFVYALVTGMQFVATGCSKRALVIGADTNSRIVDPEDIKIYPLFGDGAGAVLLSKGSPEQGLISYTLGADGSGASMLQRPMGGSLLPTCAEGLAAKQHLLRMDGRGVFKWAIRLLEETIRDVVADAGLTIPELDLVILHQANIRIMDAAAQNLGIERDKLFVNLDKYGNTSAGSVPLALDEAVAQGRIRRGDRVLFSGYGAGLAWGTGIYQW